MTTRPALLLVLALLAASRSAVQDVVNLMCRGPMEISTSDQGIGAAPGGYGPLVVIRPSSSAAGTNGQELEPGTCAFPDRALRDGEPRVLLLGDFRAVTYDRDGREPSHQTVIDGVTLNVRELLEVQRQGTALMRSDYITVLPVSLTGRPAFWETGLRRALRYVPVREERVPIIRDPRDRPTPPR